MTDDMHPRQGTAAHSHIASEDALMYVHKHIIASESLTSLKTRFPENSLYVLVLVYVFILTSASMY